MLPAVAADDPVIYLSDPQIDESSGLAQSNRSPRHLWTHNDSGDSARLFAFDHNGRVTGGCSLAAVKAIDFEDMASFVQDGVARLVVADVGDNDSVRPFVSLYFFDEPDPNRQTVIRDWLRVDLRYPDGARDCEAIAVDTETETVTLVSKSFLPIASVYELALPARPVAEGPVIKGRTSGSNGDNDDDSPPALRLVGRLPLALITAMDRCRTTGDILLTNYFHLLRFPKSAPGRPWWEQTPVITELPRLRQIEAVASDDDGRVWVSSEGTPAPLARVEEPVTP